MSEEVGVTVGLTKNLGNYNSLRLEATRKTTMQDGENVKEVFAQLWQECEDELEVKVSEYETE